MTVHRHHHAFRRQSQFLSHGVDDPAVRLMRHQPVDIGVAEAVGGQRLIHRFGQAMDGMAEHLPPVHHQVAGLVEQSPFYAAYGKVMLNPQATPGATIDLGAKDLRLLREAAAARQTNLSLADNLAEVFAEAQRTGLAGADWAVGQYRMAQRRGTLSGSLGKP